MLKSCAWDFVPRKPCLLGKSPLRSGRRKAEVHRTSCAPNPLRTLPAASGCCVSVPLRSAQSRRPPDVCFAPVPGALTAVPAKEKTGVIITPASKNFTCACGLRAFCSPRLYAFSSLHSAGHLHRFRTGLRSLLRQYWHRGTKTPNHISLFAA